MFFRRFPDIGDAEIREPCLLYPIPGKEDRIFEEPFRTAYRHFELCLLAAKTIVIIGYSGRDPIIRAHLKEALELDPVKKIIVVTGGKQLRPELEELKASCQDFVHLPDGIEANANNLPNIVAGRVGVSRSLIRCELQTQAQAALPSGSRGTCSQFSNVRLLAIVC